MKICLPFLLLLCSLLLGIGCDKNDHKDDLSQRYEVSTLAGNEQAGYVDGPGSTARFALLTDIEIDKQGNIYVLDTENRALRKITPTGVVSTLAGGSRGTADGQGTAAQFTLPYFMTLDAQGNIYVVDRFRIRKVTPAGLTITLAGAETPGYVNGAGTAARFYELTGITTDSQGNLYVVDNGVSYNEGIKIRKITPGGVVTTLSNEGMFSTHIWTDASGNLYSAGSLANNQLVKFSPTGERTVVRTLPDYIVGMAGDEQGNFYFTQGGVFSFSNEGKVFVLYPDGKTETIAGTGAVGYTDGNGSVAVFDHPSGLVLDTQGTIYVIDINRRIRKISKR